MFHPNVSALNEDMLVLLEGSLFRVRGGFGPAAEDQVRGRGGGIHRRLLQGKPATAAPHNGALSCEIKKLPIIK